MNSEDFVELMLNVAEETICGIEDENEREEINKDTEFMRAMAKGVGVKEVLRRRLGEAEKTENPHMRAGEIREIVEDMLKCGETDEALELAETVVDNYQREWTMILVAGAKAAAGRCDDALSVADGITDGDIKARALAAVGRGMRETGDGRAESILRRAFEDAKEMKDPYDTMWVMCDIARAMPGDGAGDVFSKAVDTVHDICHTVMRASAFRAIAGAMSDAGHDGAGEIIDLALESAASVDDAAGRANAYAWLVTTMKAAGDERVEATLGKAVETARGLSDAEDRSRTFRWIAGALAESGDLDNAVSLAEKIRHEFFRYEALRDVAITMVRNGKYGPAAEAVECIITPGPKVETIKELVMMVAADTGCVV